MPQDKNRLIWIDMEMSGLNPLTDRVLEVALVVTDAELNAVAEAPVLVVHQSDAVLDGMDNWNKGTHARSGLIDKVKASILDEAAVANAMIDFLKPWLPANASPMCGNSICQDRRFGGGKFHPQWNLTGSVGDLERAIRPGFGRCQPGRLPASRSIEEELFCSFIN